jgi:hypothetical protein
MATRSTIALELADGSIKQVYCHWDGYISNNGVILFNHYSDPKKLETLLDMSDISSLGKDIGVKHPFSFVEAGVSVDSFHKLYDDMTTFYGRDREEKNIRPVRVFENFKDYLAKNDSEEYNYILRSDGEWYVDSGRGHVSLWAQIKLIEVFETASA